MSYLHSRGRTSDMLRHRKWLFIGLATLLGIGIALAGHPTVQASSSFDNGYHVAQQNGQQTGDWGSAPYYIDKDDNMYVGTGELQGSFYRALGTDTANTVRSINFTATAHAPANSSLLFSPTTIGTNHSLTTINGLDKLDTTDMTDMSNMFSNDWSLRSVDLSNWYTPHLQNMGWAFLSDSSLVNANLSGMNTSQVTNGASIFSGDTNLYDVNIADWDTHDMQDMSYMFNGDESLIGLNLTGWQTHNARNMEHMFNNDFKLSTLGIYNFDTSDLSKDVNGMFSGDSSLYMLSIGSSFRIRNEESIPFDETNSNYGFNQNGLPAYTTGDIYGMYSNSGFDSGTWFNINPDNSNLEAQDSATSKWSVTNDNEQNNMPYYSASNLPANYYVNSKGSLHIGQGELKGMNLQQLMNGGQNNLKAIYVDYPADTSNESSHFDENEDSTDNWQSFMQDGLFVNTPNATLMDLRNLSVSGMNDLNQTFANDSNLNSLNISTWDTQNKSEQDMFDNDSNITDLYLGGQTILNSNANLPAGTWHNYATGETLSSAQLTDGNPHPGHWRQPQFMKYFRQAQSQGLRTGYWGTAPWYIDMTGKMHVGSGQLQGPLYATTGMDAAKSINDLSFDEKVRAPQDSSNLLSTSYISGDNSYLNGIDNLDNIDMSPITNARAMFANDTGLSGLDMSYLDTHNVTDMSYMFNNDWSMTGLNANDLDTSSVTNMQSMFYNNYRLQDPDISNWNVSRVTDMDDMFWGDGDLSNLSIGDWHPDNLETMDSMFMNNKNLGTMDLSHWNPTYLRNLHSAFVNNLAVHYMNLSGWQLPHIQNMESAFNGDSNMDHLDLGQADTSHVDDMHFLVDGTHNMDMLSLGPRTDLKDIGYLPGVEWQDGSQTLPDSQLQDGNSHPGFWQQTPFSHEFQAVQQQGGTTGHWGTAPYYIDNTGHMKVGSGVLNGPLPSIVGYDRAKTLKGLDFTEHVRAPQDSSNLLSTSFSSGDDSSLSGIDNLDNVDMSQVTNAKAMFANDTGLKGLDMSHLDTHNVQDMGFMFYDDWSMTGLNANRLDTSHVGDMQSMFFNDKLLSNVQVSNWDTSQVRGMAYMFADDNALQSLNVADWNTNLVQSMSGMFLNDFQLHDFDISHWNTNNLTDMSGMFINDRAISYLDLSGWNSGWQIPKLQDMESAFNGDSGIQHLDIGNVDTENAHDMHYLMNGDNGIHTLDLGPATRLTGIDYLPGVEWRHGNDLANDDELKDNSPHWGTWQQTQFSDDFQNAQQKHWDTGYWGDTPFYLDDKGNMYVGTGRLSGSLYDALGNDSAHNHVQSVHFVGRTQAPQDSSFLLSTSSHNNNDTQLRSIDGLDHLDTSRTTNMNSMFANDSRLQDVDASQLDTHNVTDMSYMFSSDTNLRHLNVNHWDTSQVTNMHSILAGGESLSGIDTQGWDTSRVQDLSFAFYGDKALQNVDLDHWNTKDVTTLASIFSEDTQLQDVNVKDWDVRNVQDMNCAFLNDSSLTALNLSGWQTGHLNDTRSAFAGMTNLSSIDLSNFNTSSVTDARYMFDNDEKLDDMTLGNQTDLSRLTYLPGIEWENDGHILHNEQLRDGNNHAGHWYQTTFSHEYQDAQGRHDLTGRWGDAPFYIADNHALHVGSGHLFSNLDNNVGDFEDQSLQSIDMEEPVVAPANSSFLFSTSNLGKTNASALANIQGLDQVDMSAARDINFIFAKDYQLNDLDLSSWDTSNIHRMQSLFFLDRNLDHLNVGDWNTSNVSELQYAFFGMSNLMDLDLHNWSMNRPIDRDHLFAADNNLTNLTLGPATTLSPDVGLPDGLWQTGRDDNLNERDLTNGQSRPGDWQWVPTQEDDRNLFGTNYDSLLGLIERQYGLGHDDGQNVQIMRDDQSQDSNGHLKPGNYHDIYYAIKDDGTRVYHDNLNVIAYTSGDDLVGNTSQSPLNLLRSHYGNSVTVDDDGGSQNGDRSMNYGDYKIRYHYQDSSGNTNYRISNLQVLDNTQTSAPYLIVSDHPNEELYDTADLKQRLVQFWGASDDSKLELTNVGNGRADYHLRDGDHSYAGSIQAIAAFQNDGTMDHAPGASDGAFWNDTVMNAFDSMDGITFDHSNVDSYQTDARTGITQIRGSLYPSAGQFINGVSVPYELRIQPTIQRETVDNTVNDKQVQDVIDSLGSHPHLVSVTDGNGVDVTGSFGELSTIPQNSNVTIQVRTDEGYHEVHFAHIGDIVEPNVDVTHDSTTDGNDISNDDLQKQIMGLTHESALDNFSIDNSQMVSPSVKAVQYHFTNDTTAAGNKVNVTTRDNVVSGTAYVHYTNDDTTTSPTFTVTQGSNPVQHIEDMTGHPVRILQTADDHDINDLPVGSYDIIYQDTDTSDSTEYHATITVTPSYYFSPVTDDAKFQGNDNEAGYFHSYDYQDHGNAYKSVVDTQDYTSDKQDSSSQQDDSTVDGLHTTDGKPAHFDSNNPYDK